MSKVRVRFAPSPTGYLHVGGARTALFNWLFARQQGGTFVLRIEDTDLERSTEASIETILEGMKFLGLDWDEGPEVGGPYAPYLQTERLDIYNRYVEMLLEKGRAYPCFCTPEELDERRQAARERGEAPKYDRKCRTLSAGEVEDLRAQGKTPVIRFDAYAVADEATVVDDLIRGKVRFENELLDDFVILKSEGVPTYNFAVVVDDAQMEITHVIRGDDHLSNTPRQILLYEALDLPVPKFAHIPMILGPDKSRLSKRHGATSVTQYRDEGYLPQALVNYLALLGWSYDDSQTLFGRQELVEKFSLAKCSKNPAVFDTEKLKWMNGVYIRQESPEDLLEAAIPYWEMAGFDLSAKSNQELIKILSLVQERLKTLNEVVEFTDFFFQDVSLDPTAVTKVLLKREGIANEMLELADALEATEPFTEEEVEKAYRGLAEAKGLKAGDVIQPARVALSGRTASPGIFEVTVLLGKEVSLHRIRRVAQELTAGDLK